MSSIRFWSFGVDLLFWRDSLESRLLTPHLLGVLTCVCVHMCIELLSEKCSQSHLQCTCLDSGITLLLLSLIDHLDVLLLEGVGQVPCIWRTYQYRTCLSLNWLWNPMPNYMICFMHIRVLCITRPAPPYPQELGPKGDTAPETSLPWAAGREGFDIFCRYIRSMRFLNWHIFFPFMDWYWLLFVNIRQAKTGPIHW